jgi:hypothetical protein
MERKTDFYTLLGKFVGKVIVFCITAIITLGVLALSVKAVQGLLLWLF